MSIGMEKRKEEKKMVETGIRVAFIGIAVWIISF